MIVQIPGNAGKMHIKTYTYISVLHVSFGFIFYVSHVIARAVGRERCITARGRTLIALNVVPGV